MSRLVTSSPTSGDTTVWPDSASLAATVFHFGTLRVGQVKDAIADAGFPVRRASLAIDRPTGETVAT